VIYWIVVVYIALLSTTFLVSAVQNFVKERRKYQIERSRKLKGVYEWNDN